MKIATWNLERLEKNKTNQIIEILNKLDADILVLTETSRTISLENYNVIHTKELPNNFDGIQYKNGETRVSVFSKYEVLSQYPTYDEYTAICVELRTPMGDLLVYGSIIGVFGNKQPKFNYDLNGQLDDFKQLFPNKLICLAGDFNITLSGRAWPSKIARQEILNLQECFNLTSETKKIENAVDHILLSKAIVENRKLELNTWNIDKILSDHEGYVLRII